jgi:DNA adenine methylase
MQVPHPIPYQGSKRGIAREILRYFPRRVLRLVEPFAGSAAITIAAAAYRKAERFWINDLNAPLTHLWQTILQDPERIADDYRHLWEEQAGREREYYDLIRQKFNQTHRPDYFLYLLARCVKASVRYNANGEFNQSPDNRRRGMHPATMRRHLLNASRLLSGRTLVTAWHYRDVLDNVCSDDLVYMDPPYQGVCRGRDPRYYTDMDHEEFINWLYKLNAEGIAYLLSYDGHNDLRQYWRPLPDDLKLTRVEIHAGRSAQATLLGIEAYTVESLYLSPALVATLDNLPEPPVRQQQYILFEAS